LSRIIQIYIFSIGKIVIDEEYCGMYDTKYYLCYAMPTNSDESAEN
jgi:hypothetical protein